MPETTIQYVVKFHLQDIDELGRPSLQNIWVAAQATSTNGAVATAMKMLDRNGINIANVRFVGFEDTANLKGNQQ